MKLSSYRLTAAVLSIAVLITVFPAKAVKADTRRYTEEELQETIDGIIEWCREEYGAAGDETLFGERYLSGAGTSGCDWYPIGMSRSGWEEDYSLYLEALTAQVKERYKEEDKLDAAKATEWHRITLAVLACGGDPTALTYDESGAPINLIADGVYNRGLTENLGKQGINGWIWGLIALDSMRYEVPQGAYYTRDDIITQILCAQLDDGGYDLAAASADPDMTAMAIQALAPYYHSSKEYTYTRKGQEEPQTRTVRQVIDEATETLSRLQDEEGGYSSWGMANVESADQVLVALCSIGVDPQSDERFIKNGNTILDSVMSFRLEDGGFLHAKVYDEANPTSLPDESNPMAGYQTLYALTAVLRQMRGENTLYDFRPEGSDQTPPNDPLAVLTDIPETSEELQKIADELIFPQSRQEQVEEILARGMDSTEFYVEVAMAAAELASLPEFTGREELLSRLAARQEELLALADKITALNEDIAASREVLESGTLEDKELVDGLYARYEALSEYDRSLVEDAELLELAKQAAEEAAGRDQEARSRSLTMLSVAAAAFLALAIFFSWRKKKENG